MRTAIMLALLLAMPAAAQVAKGPPAPDAVVAALPAELAGWRRGEVTDFERRPNGAGLGASVEFRPAAGGAGVVTVYVYDRGRTDLADGATLTAAEELRRAIGEIEALGPGRRYTVAERRPGPEVAAPNGRPALGCQSLVLAFEGGNRADSIACVGVVRGRFLKLRATFQAAAEGMAATAVAAFGQEVVAEVLRGPATAAPAPAPAARGPKS